MTSELDREIHKILDFLYFCECHDMSIPHESNLEYALVEYFSLDHEEAHKIIKIFWQNKEQQEDTIWKAPDFPTRGSTP